ncbi:hypothetical protein AB751O23_AK_00260 [Chlamydiales bacterium SCGC AB-751-O23]|jgi:lipid A 4'-phosphatase|nr:hypothetical protein AB751O23_AK_00260 [Chlamydiales bacterium SCGC AB-751-O23]
MELSNLNKKNQLKMKALTLFILILTCLVAYFCKELDFFFAQLFFNDETFFLKDHLALKIIFKSATLPGWIVGITCLFVLVFPFLSPSLKVIKRQILFLLLSLIIGPGLLVNVLFKDHWGRPRPVQTLDFKGKQEYVEFYKPQFSNPYPSKSFPSGHASMGFYFMSFIFLGRRVRNNQLKRLGYGLTLLLAPLLSATRIAQGGHYFSDIWMSGVIVYFTCLLLDWYLLKNFHNSSSGSKSFSAW